MSNLEFQTEVNLMASKLEEIAYDDDFDDYLDYFGGAAGISYREDDSGEFQSAFVFLAWGHPTIELDTAKGTVEGHNWLNHGIAFLSNRAIKNINGFFRALHDC